MKKTYDVWNNGRVLWNNTLILQNINIFKYVIAWKMNHMNILILKIAPFVENFLKKDDITKF